MFSWKEINESFFFIIYTYNSGPFFCVIVLIVFAYIVSFIFFVRHETHAFKKYLIRTERGQVVKNFEEKTLI